MSTGRDTPDSVRSSRSHQQAKRRFYTELADEEGRPVRDDIAQGTRAFLFELENFLSCILCVLLNIIRMLKWWYTRSVTVVISIFGDWINSGVCMYVHLHSCSQLRLDWSKSSYVKQCSLHTLSFLLNAHTTVHGSGGVWSELTCCVHLLFQVTGSWSSSCLSPTKPPTLRS